MNKLTASEALYGFAAWLKIQSDAAPIEELMDTFCKENNLEPPRYGWQKWVASLNGECSGPAREPLTLVVNRASD